MRIVPIRYCSDVAEAKRFYRALGLEDGSISRPGSWAELPAASGMLAVHEGDDDAGVCELAFEADEPLEAIMARLRAAGFTPEPITDQNFGRSMRVRDPDGVWVQINQLDRELYT
ncbi:MAG: VOC family protein [Pseudonocardiaceae bacterium]|nr:VOC family protein [Pseudonocardiaceae bacterium]